MAQKIVPGKASGILITENELGEECCWWWWWKWANNSRQVPRKERDFLNPTEEKFLVFPSPTSTSLREHHGNCQFPKSFTSLSIFFFFPIHTRLLVNWKVARDNTMWTWTCVEFSLSFDQQRDANGSHPYQTTHQQPHHLPSSSLSHHTYIRRLPLKFIGANKTAAADTRFWRRFSNFEFILLLNLSKHTTKTTS